MGLAHLIGEADWTTALACTVVGTLCGIVGYRIARYRTLQRLKPVDRTEAILLELLHSPHYDMQSFQTIQSVVPLSDEKLREALIRVGAVCFVRGRNRQEHWGLLEKHRDKLFPPTPTELFNATHGIALVRPN